MCPYAINECDVILKKVTCKITGEGCYFWRYCPEKDMPLMTPMYNKYGCKIKTKYEEDKIGK